MRKYTSDQVRISLITDALTEIENYLQNIDFEVFNGKIRSGFATKRVGRWAHYQINKY